MKQQTKQNLKKVHKVGSKILDIPILLFCFIAIAAFIFILYESIIGNMLLFRGAINLQGKMFFIGILVAIISGCSYYLEGLIRLSGKTFRHLFNKEKEVTNE